MEAKNLPEVWFWNWGEAWAEREEAEIRHRLAKLCSYSWIVATEVIFCPDQSQTQQCLYYNPTQFLYVTLRNAKKREQFMLRAAFPFLVNIAICWSHFPHQLWPRTYMKMTSKVTNVITQLKESWPMLFNLLTILGMLLKFLKVVMLYIMVLPRAYLTPRGIVMCRREMDFSAARTRAVQKKVV